MTSRPFILLQVKTKKKTSACIYKPKLYMSRDKKRQILGPFVLGHIDCDNHFHSSTYAVFVMNLAN